MALEITLDDELVIPIEEVITELLVASLIVTELTTELDDDEGLSPPPPPPHAVSATPQAATAMSFFIRIG